VRIHAASGAAVGSAKTTNLAPYGWSQINDVFARTGSGTRNDAYAKVEVLTAGCTVWAYAAVIDGTAGDPGTGDPTAIPVVVVE